MYFKTIFFLVIRFQDRDLLRAFRSPELTRAPPRQLVRVVSQHPAQREWRSRLPDYYIDPIKFHAEGKIPIRSLIQKPAFTDSNTNRRENPIFPELGSHPPMPGIESILSGAIVYSRRDFQVPHTEQFLARRMRNNIMVTEETIDRDDLLTPGTVACAAMPWLMIRQEVERQIRCAA